MKRVLVLLSGLLVSSAMCWADEFIYANNASNGTPYVYQIDLTTGGNVVNTYTNLSGTNGRGLAVVGNTMFYTGTGPGSGGIFAGDDNLYSYNLTTQTSNAPQMQFTPGGVATTMAGVAFDGTNFWVSEYSGQDRRVFEYSQNGTLLKTLQLQNCQAGCDGLEYVTINGVGYLIENRGDSQMPYDMYDLNGNLVKANFLNPGLNIPSGTGIAFDGTNFYTARGGPSPQAVLDEWDINGNHIGTINITGIGGSTPADLEDLSFAYAGTVTGTGGGGGGGGNTVPEPSSVMLLGTGLAGFALRQFKKRN